MNPMDSIIQQVHLATAERMAVNEALRDEARIVLKQINEVIVDFDKAASHIYKSSDFTQEGKKSHIGKLALDYQERIEHITNPVLVSLDDRIAQVQAEIIPQEPDGDPVVQELQMQEARRLLSNKDELELQALYYGWAVDGGNDHLMRAVETSPLPMISDASVLEKGKEARTQRQNPKSVIIFNQLKDVRDLIQSAKRGAITHFGLMGDTDAVAQLAKTGTLNSMSTH